MYKRQVYNVIDSRYRSGKPLIVTTNHTPDMLENPQDTAHAVSYTHLVDLTNYDLTGKAVEKLLDSVNITCNKNTIPNDPKSPFVTSGVRLGTCLLYTSQRSA